MVRRRRIAVLALALVLAGVGVAAALAGGRAAKPGHGPQRGSERRSSSLAASAPIVNLASGSDPSVLPGPVLIADRSNNRLLEVSPRGHIMWAFPRPGDLARGQTFKVPDDAFYTADGQRIVATEEDDFVISVIDVRAHRIVYRYGHPGVPGSSPDYLYNPDDAMLSPQGQLISADIKNCRIIIIQPPAHDVLRHLGQTGTCVHQAGQSYGSPNGAFPADAGQTIVTEINGDWIDVLAPGGRVVSVTNAPSFSYPSDTNEVRPGVLLSADYTTPGAIETFTSSGRLLWRYAPSAGPGELDHPSLALPLPNGDILANDDRNDRVIVIDPHTNRIVWQYGHTHRPGWRAGYLSTPDGVDLAAPNNLLHRYAASIRFP